MAGFNIWFLSCSDQRLILTKVSGYVFLIVPGFCVDRWSQARVICLESPVSSIAVYFSNLNSFWESGRRCATLHGSVLEVKHLPTIFYFI